MNIAPFLNISLVQSDLHWEDVQKNLFSFSEKIKSLNEVTDLIILPEMFNSGFTMNARKYHEKMEGKTMLWMQQRADEKQCVVTGSIIIKEKKEHFNRLIWMPPGGNYEFYDKRHLFRMMDEDNHYSPGAQRLITDLKGWKICPMICYDLRFPVWCRNRMIKVRSQKSEVKNKKSAVGSRQLEYDLLIFIANWPEVRRSAWRSLLQVRAIENQAYVAGVNRVGKDGNGIAFSGNSEVFDTRGNSICTTRAYEEKIETVKLPYIDMKEFREKFPVGLDADEFIIKGNKEIGK